MIFLEICFLNMNASVLSFLSAVSEKKLQVYLSPGRSINITEFALIFLTLVTEDD